MDVKATFTAKVRQSVLEPCEFGEDASQKAYSNALASDEEINADTRQLINFNKNFHKILMRLLRNT